MTDIKNNHQQIHNNLRRTFIAAAIFHILLTTLIYLIGANDLLPGMFNSRGIGEFASDGDGYIREIISLVEILRQQGLIAFIAASSKFHIKLYTISFALLQPFFGFTILSGELFNLFSYLAILWLVNAIGREIFTPKVGLSSVWIVGLWPSFLLYTTQLYKTPLFIIVFLVLVLVATRLLSPGQQAKRTVVHFVLGLFAIVILWFIRNEWWTLFIALALLGFLCLVIQMVIERQLKIWQMMASAFLLLITLAIPKYASDFLYSLSSLEGSAPEVSSPVAAAPAASPSAAPSDTESSETIPSPVASSDRSPDCSNISEILIELLEKFKNKSDSLAIRIGQQRYGFTSIPTSGSDIDEDVYIKNMSDLMRYLPRAIAIGLFAPFPDMWFSGGAKLGLSARMLSGLETFFMYGIHGLSVLGIWHVRRRLPAWYLVATILIGATALGLVVGNVGALFRFRYSFWMISIIFGVGGYNLVAYPLIRDVLQRFRKTR